MAVQLRWAEPDETGGKGVVSYCVQIAAPPVDSAQEQANKVRNSVMGA